MRFLAAALVARLCGCLHALADLSPEARLQRDRKAHRRVAERAAATRQAASLADRRDHRLALAASLGRTA